MRSFQVFARMQPAQIEGLLEALREKSQDLYQHAVLLAAAAMKARPQYLLRQPFPKRAAAIRRALARVSNNAVAEELLAAYFLDSRKDLLVEWLDLLGLKHEEGVLEADVPEPPTDKKLEAALKTFRKPDDSGDREMLLQAFAAQNAIDWPSLDAALEVSD